MQHMKRGLFLFALVSLTSGCLIGEGPEGDEEEDDLAFGAGDTAGIRVVQHNIEKKPAVLQRALRKAMDIDAHVVALQEVCPSEVAWLRQNLGGRWTIGEVAGKKPAITGCDLPDGTHDKPSSVVMWTKGTGGKVTAYSDLSNPSTAPGAMVCVQFERAKVKVHACSAHLIAGDWKDPATGIVHDGAKIRLQETTRIKQIARDNWFDGAKNHFGIIAGDLNGQPTSEPIDKLYDNALGGSGEFTEYNRNGGGRDGTATAHADGDGTPFSRKIDYVFFSTNRAPIDGPAVDIIPTDSDHDMVVSTVRMKK